MHAERSEDLSRAAKASASSRRPTRSRRPLAGASRARLGVCRSGTRSWWSSRTSFARRLCLRPSAGYATGSRGLPLSIGLPSGAAISAAKASQEPKSEAEDLPKGREYRTKEERSAFAPERRCYECGSRLERAALLRCDLEIRHCYSGCTLFVGSPEANEPSPRIVVVDPKSAGSRRVTSDPSSSYGSG
jgi:hypothetical protein